MSKKLYKNVGTIMADDYSWIVKCRPHVKSIVAGVFAGSVDASMLERDDIRIAKNEVNGKLLFMLINHIDFDYEMCILQDITRYSRRYGENRNNRAKAVREEISLSEAHSGDMLYPFQRSAVRLSEHTSFLLADDMGMGKTVTAIGAMQWHGRGVVFCPASVGQQWIDKIEEFTNIPCHLAQTSKAEWVPFYDSENYILVVPYSRLWNNECEGEWWEYIQGLKADIAIMDEIHELGNGQNTMRGQAVMRAIKNIPRRIGLSGTPIRKSIKDLYNIFQYIDPEILGQRSTFEITWNNVAEVSAFLTDECRMLRREFSDYGEQLPKIIDYFEEVEWRHCNVPEDDSVARLRGITAVAKAIAVIDRVEKALETEEKVVLFAHSRSAISVYQSYLDAAKVKYSMFTGSETSRVKESEKKKFISGKSRVMIMAIQAGAGVDGLQDVCNTVIFGELDWCYSQVIQCIKRIHRKGQSKPCKVIFCYCDLPLDARMVQILKKKRELILGLTHELESDDDLTDEIESLSEKTTLIMDS